MIAAPVDTSPWGLSCASPFSAGKSSFTMPLSDEYWLSGFDFSDVATVPLISADLAELLTLDCAEGYDISDGAEGFDICDLLLPEENGLPSIFVPKGADGAALRSDSFSSILGPNGINGTVHQNDGFSSIFGSCGAEGGATHQVEPSVIFEEVDPLLNTDSCTESSRRNSNQGSSVAVGEGAFVIAKGLETDTEGLGNHGRTLKNPMTYSAASSHNRQHEDLGSDLEGGDRERKSQMDPSDRKQHRLLRNRELAFESRQRKKCYVNDLEMKCKMLEHERDQLQQQICFSTAENAVLKEELNRMKKMKGRDGVAEPAVLFKGSLPLEFLSLLICLFFLMARLSPCVSPSLALMLRIIYVLPSPIKAGGLLKEPADCKKRSYFRINRMRQFLEHHWNYAAFVVCGLFMAWLTLTFSYLEQCFCKALRASIS